MDQGWAKALADFEALRSGALAMGGTDALERQTARGKLSARARLDLLLDDGSFHELGQLVEGEVVALDGARSTVPADAVVCGWGRIDNRQVFVAADDGSMMGGAGSTLNIEKRFRVRQMAIQQRCPFIGLYEGSAIRFQDSMDAGRMARIPAFKEVVDCAGVVPQIAAVLGPAFGRPPMDVLFSDFSVQAEGTGFVALSGPALVAGGVGEDADMEELSGTSMHVDTTGLVDRSAADEAECLALIRTFLGFMPQSAWSRPPSVPATDPIERLCPELVELVPSNLRKPYDMEAVVNALVDDGGFFAYKPTFGRSLITGLARIGGESVGVIASQPNSKGGVIDADACIKARRFVSMCNAFHVPLVFLQDQPGFLIGTQSERDRILYWAGSLLATVQRARVPTISVILRKSHGAAVWAMGSQSVGGNLVVAWPIAIMTGTGPRSAVNTIHARDLAAAESPRDLQAELEMRYNRTGSAARAAATFGIDDVIHPADTRRFLASALAMTRERSAADLRPVPTLFP